jgi:nucleotide-binding universal stress UspA family protein
MTDSTLATPKNPVRRGPVLLAVHGAESSSASIRAARLLADHFGVSLRVVTVLEPEPSYGRMLSDSPVVRANWEEYSAGQKETVQRALSQAIGDTGWELEVREGQAAREICLAAEGADATMVVVDASPRPGIRRPVSGVRALQILRGAPCPVLSVAADFKALPRTIVAAVDFSPASIRAVQAALLLAGARAKIILVNIPSVLHFSHPVRDKSGALYGDMVDEWFARVREELRPYSPPDLTIETTTGAGTIVDEILRVADEAKAEVIVSGTQGPNAVQRFFVGSSAAGLLHRARCSVLSSPAPRPAEFSRLSLRLVDTLAEENTDKWQEMLDAVTKRDAGRRMTLEVDDPAFGAQVEARGYRLRGVTYDPHDRRIAIMVAGDAGEQPHLTRTIDHPRSIAITSSAGRDQALEIRHGRGHTLVLFDD